MAQAKALAKALIVGVAKPSAGSGWKADWLTGVDDDVLGMKQLLLDHQFDVEVLENQRATRGAVLDHIDHMAKTLSAGDFFVFVYSGHGGQRNDLNLDEDDRQDECLLVYDQELNDDDLAVRWQRFKKGVRILTLMDACHSGTMVRVASRSDEQRQITRSRAQPPTVGLLTKGATSTRSADFDIAAKLIHMGACRDRELASDTPSGGLFTRKLRQAMQDGPSDYDALHRGILRYIGSGRQVSQMLVFGPGVEEFRKEKPFTTKLLTDEQKKKLDDVSSDLLDFFRPRGASPDDRGEVVAPMPVNSSHGIILSRPPKHRIDLVLNGNSITDVRAKAYVLGLFDGVTPSGAAGAIDDILGGTISDFVNRRMFSAKVGEVFMLPTGNAPLQADVVLFVGLGQLDQFLARPDEVQRLAAGNVVRTLIRLGIDEFASVLIGGGSGQTVRQTLSNLIDGFAAGLRDIGSGDRSRRVILCENTPERYAEMVETVYAYGRTDKFDDVRLTIFEEPPTVSGSRRVPRATSVSEYRSRMFLHVQHEVTDEEECYQAVLLTPGGKATAIPSTQPFDPDDRDALLRRIATKNFEVAGFGEQLAELVLSGDFIEFLGSDAAAGQHLVIVHDAESSKLPWETLRCGGRALALDGGISRKYLLSGNYSIAKWLEQRRFDESLDILLVVNPTEDLPGAEKEGRIVQGMIQNIPGVRVTPIHGSAATKDRLLGEFRSGAYDVIHYAGHAAFDEDAPGNSGILCSDHRVLTGNDLAVLESLPALVFFNACESGRVRGSKKAFQRLQQSVSFAEAFLRGGIANFLGTYWSVGDASAEAFARIFYSGLVKGWPVGDALIAGRTAVHAADSYDWADYIHYGDPDFRIKEGTTSTC